MHEEAKEVENEMEGFEIEGEKREDDKQAKEITKEMKRSER